MIRGNYTIIALLTGLSLEGQTIIRLFRHIQITSGTIMNAPRRSLLSAQKKVLAIILRQVL